MPLTFSPPWRYNCVPTVFQGGGLFWGVFVCLFLHARDSRARTAQRFFFRTVAAHAIHFGQQGYVSGFVGRLDFSEGRALECVFLSLC